MLFCGRACKQWSFKMAWVSTCCVLAIQKVFTEALFSPRLPWLLRKFWTHTHQILQRGVMAYIYIYLFIHPICSKKTIYVCCDVVVVKLLNRLYFLKMQYPKVPCHSHNSIKYSHISISPLVCGWRRGCVPPDVYSYHLHLQILGPRGFLQS